MNKKFKIKQFNNSKKINTYNRKNSIAIGLEVKFILHDAIVFSGTVTKENIDKIQKMIAYSDNYIIK
ncbi:hypothetical protein ACYJ2U_001832 [Clostridium botulinum]